MPRAAVEAGQDRQKDGFVAASRAEELRCPTQNADVLVGIEDITARVNAATAGMDDKTAGDVRRKTLTQIEQACEQAAGTADPRRCETVKLYKGGQYFLYQYKRYDDVRIVFAPETDIGAFGGDPDNFQFPRWSLDMGLLRVYENGKPATTPNFLTIDWTGPDANEPVFVPGHPGSTDRQLTVAQLEALRASLPAWLLRAGEQRGRLIQFAQGGEENARKAGEPLNNLENGIKVRRKQMDALLDPALMAQKARDEADLRAKAGLAGPQDPLGADRARHPRLPGHQPALRLSRRPAGDGGGVQQRAVPLRPHAGARRRRAAEAERRTAARIPRHRAAARGAPPAGRRARVSRRRGNHACRWA